MTIQHILRLRTRLHKSLRRVFKHAIMRVDKDIQMGETSDNDDDLRSELHDDDDEQVGSMEPLRVGVRRRLLLAWQDVHAALVTAPTPTHGPARASAG